MRRREEIMKDIKANTEIGVATNKEIAENQKIIIEILLDMRDAMRGTH